MKRWGATFLVWLFAPAAGLVVFLALSTAMGAGRLDWENATGAAFAILWFAAAFGARRLHSRKAGRVIHTLGCVLLFPVWCLLLLLSFL